MAKTGGKRKAEDVIAEEKEVSFATENGRINYGNDVDCDDADDVTAKTPAAKKSTAKNTPGSSGGMKMRSGRKKKRPKLDSTTAVGGISAVGVTPRKQTKRGTNEDDAVTSGEHDGTSNESNGKDKADNDEEMDTETDERKLSPEVTRVAVAPVQVAEHTVEAGEVEDGDKGEANNHAPTNGAGTSLPKLVTQNLRLPSQHTPKSARAATAAVAETVTPAAPPGGRRLLFQSAQKSSSAADGQKNTLLMQTRQQQRTTTAVELPPTEDPQPIQLEQLQQNGNDGTSGFTIAATPLESSSFFTQFDKEDTILYTQAWFLFLVIFFVFGNLVSVMSRDGSLASEGQWSMWNVKVQGERLANWYNIEPSLANATTIATIVDDENNEDAPAEDTLLEEEPGTIIETVTVTDPDLLSSARAALRAHRMNLHDIQKLETSMKELQEGMGMLGSTMQGWMGLNPMVMEEIVSSDVVIFSKSYCPYCQATKKLFNNLMAEKYDDSVYTKVIELDKLQNGADIQSVLLGLTGQRTVPNVFVRGRHVGGNDQVQAAAKSGELENMLRLDMVLEMPSSDSDGKKPSYDRIDSMRSSIADKHNLLMEWESALEDAEESLNLLHQGEIGPTEVNQVVGTLSEVSMIPGTSAMILDVAKISVPGEGCEGMDYVPLKPEEEEGLSDFSKEDETVDVVGGIDVNALDFASDAPVRFEDAQTAYQRLLKLSQATSETLVGETGPSSPVKRWALQIIEEELQNEGIDGKPPPIDEIHQPIVTPEDTAISSEPSDPDYYVGYTAHNAMRDIDRLLEVEDADRTGKFDYASIIHGASVVRRGPYATSYSLYETLPLVNRILAYLKLRFYGHPPEVTLLPTFPMHARGQCWSFPNEFSSPRTRGQTLDEDGIRGDYATLTVSLTSAITITEIMIEHVSPNISSDPNTAIKEFRVVGFEDGGAYGEPWELGTFKFAIGPTMQAFSIPTMLDGQNVPKLKSVAIAVDSNWGQEEYSCLYRVRVHGA